MIKFWNNTLKQKLRRAYSTSLQKINLMFEGN
mgnify:CR=1